MEKGSNACPNKDKHSGKVPRLEILR